MNQEAAENWYTFEEVLEIMKCSPRKLRSNLKLVSENCIQERLQDRGRPCKIYHHLAFPELAAWHKTNRLKVTEVKPVPDNPQPADNSQQTLTDIPQSLSAAQLAIAELRVTAVLEYRERRKALSAEDAAQATCRDWAARPRETSVMVEERLPNNHKRVNKSQISVGGFKARTLREWDRLYMETKSIKALAPQWSKCGRRDLIKKDTVKENDVLAVYAIANSTARSDIKNAVDYLKTQKPDFPAVSIRTWQRWILNLDPLKAAKAMNHSITRFRQDVSPDIETDWSKLSFNQLWTLDDISMDWLAFNSQNKTFRPYAYAIQRVSTRQWIAVVSSETPICNEQVRTLIGCAMASSQGGIPIEIKFERGSVSCGPHLRWLLLLLGIKVSETSLNQGEVFPGAYEESLGHPQGKPTIESNARRLHNLGWNMPGQVGSEERHTMPPRVEALRKEADLLAKDGKFLLIPQATEYHKMILTFIEQHNNKPHSGLPQKVDPLTGKAVYLTPNEMAQHLKDVQVKVMDPELLMMFHVKGERVPVSQNGIRLDKKTYGRFDPALREFDAVTAYIDPNFPNQAFVQELGRYVELYEKAEPGEYGEQFEKKRSCEKKHKNKYRAAIAAALEAQKEGALLIDQVNITSNPVPDRASFVMSNDFLRLRIANMQAAMKHLEEQKKAEAANLDFHSDRLNRPASTGTRPAARRKSVLDASRRLGSLLSVPAAMSKTESGG